MNSLRSSVPEFLTPFRNMMAATVITFTKVTVLAVMLCSWCKMTRLSATSQKRVPTALKSAQVYIEKLMGGLTLEQVLKSSCVAFSVINDGQKHPLALLAVVLLNEFLKSKKSLSQGTMSII